jgi:hypothetical protein
MPGIPFNSLHKAVHDWLTSDTVFNIVSAINTKHDLVGDELRAVSGALVGIATGVIPPEQFVKYLEKKLPFLSDTEILDLSEELRRRVLKQIQATLHSVYGIDIEKIPTVLSPKVAPRTMNLEKPAPAAPHTPLPPRVTPVVPERPKARVMEMASVVDLRRPAAAPQNTPAAPATPRMGAQTMEIQGRSFSPATGAGTPPTHSAAGQKTPATPQEKAVLESEKPFGLAESVPTPPAVHDVMKYQDEHPMKVVAAQKPAPTAPSSPATPPSQITPTAPRIMPQSAEKK